jgi:hypothetical protein
MSTFPKGILEHKVATLDGFFSTNPIQTYLKSHSHDKNKSRKHRQK